MQLTNVLEVDGINHTVKRYYDFTTIKQKYYELDSSLETLLVKAIEFSDYSLLSSNIQSNHFKNLFLNTFNRGVVVADNVASIKDEELKFTRKEIEENQCVIISLTGTKYLDLDKKIKNPNYNIDNISRHINLKVVNALKLLGIFRVVVGNWNSYDSSKSKMTRIYLEDFTKINLEFIKYLKFTSTELKFEEFMNILVALYSPSAFKDFFRFFDWNNLEKLSPSTYESEQAKVRQVVYNRSQDPSVDIFTGTYKNRKSEKNDRKNFTTNDLECKRMDEVNNSFKTPYTKSLNKYTRKFLRYTDLTDFRETDGKSLNYEHGGRLYSHFSGIDKNHRKLFMKSLELEEVDIPSAQFKILETIVTGKYYEGRLYNIITRAMLETKKLNRIMSSEDFDFLVSSLSEILKKSIMRPYNTDNEIDCEKSILKELTSKAYITTTLSKEENIMFMNTDGSVDYVNRIIYKTEKRNKLFLDNKGDTEDNRRLLKLLGNTSISPKAIISTLRKEVPELRHFMFTSNWNSTQYIESELMVNIILKEMRKDNLSPYMIHDAIFVPKKLVPKYTKLLEDGIIKEVKKFKSKKLMGVTKNPEVFNTTISKLYNLNNRKFAIPNNKQYQRLLSKYRYISDVLLKSNTRANRFDHNKVSNSIWNDRDLLLMNNLTNTSEKLLFIKLNNYLNFNFSYDMNKFLSSMYIYTQITGKMLIEVNSKNIDKISRSLNMIDKTLLILKNTNKITKYLNKNTNKLTLLNKNSNKKLVNNINLSTSLTCKITYSEKRLRLGVRDKDRPPDILNKVAIIW